MMDEAAGDDQFGQRNTEFNHPLVGSSQVSGSRTVPFPGKTIGQVLLDSCLAYPNCDALISRAQDLRYSWRELGESVDALAKGMLAKGFVGGDRVAVWSMNCAEWVVLQLATARVGMVLVTINPSYRQEELRYALNLVQCSAFFVGRAYKGSDFGAMLDQVIADPEFRSTGRPMLVVGMDGCHSIGCTSWHEVLEAGKDCDTEHFEMACAAVRDCDPINIQFTSGTTGFPKGVTLSHRNIVNNGWFTGKALGIESVDRLCLPVPLFHCFGMVTGVLMCLTHGATLILPGPGFDAQATLDAISSEQCTAVYGVPTMYVAMLGHPRFDEMNFASMRTGIMAGSLCPESLIEQAMRRMNMRDIAICYGMTEAPVSFQTVASDSLAQRMESVGRIQPYIEAKLVDEGGKTVPTGSPGEICVRGYNTMIGYWRNESATASTIDAEGWLRTGDLGVLDEDGYLKIVGRLKDMVIRGGENLYPKEIEEFLHRHEAILDVQVFGVSDELFGEELCAWIVLQPGVQLEESDLRDYCRGRISHHKIPRYFRFVDGFPMTASGKVQKSVLRQLMEAELAEALG